MLKDHLENRLLELTIAECPRDLACGDDDAWLAGNARAIKHTRWMLAAVQGKWSAIPADEHKFVIKDLLEERTGILYRLSATVDSEISYAEESLYQINQGA